MYTINNESTVTNGKQILIQRKWWGHFLWLLTGAILAFTISAVFSGIFHLPRDIYLIPYIVLISAILFGYMRWSNLSLRMLIYHRWRWGLVGGIIVGFFAIHSVVQQPSSPTPQGVELIFKLLWLGFIYGTVDGLLLSVLPVFAVWEAMTKLGWTVGWPGSIGAGMLALLASMLVIAIYHLGYPEFRGTQVMYPVFGVGVMSLAYLITGNPISAVISHIAMHITAVLYGLQTAMQLPPHY